MFKGYLTISGTIDLAQFWPAGGSDGDTVYVTVRKDSFRFTPDPGHVPPKATSAIWNGFKESTVKDKATDKSKRTWVPVLDKKTDMDARVTVRLQGMDTPELHYRGQVRRPKASQGATLPKLQYNQEYRQYFGETAGIHLHDLIAAAGQDVVPCTVVTHVDKPGDVFDTYYRLIGEILVDVHKVRINVNHQMVEDGFAFPAYYNSMLVQEIDEFEAKAKIARSKRKGTVWQYLTQHVGQLNRNLVYRGKGNKAQPNPAADRGAVLEPKLFRRQTSFWLGKWNGIGPASFHEFVAQGQDGWTDLAVFRKKPASAKPQNRNFGPLVNTKDDYGRKPGSIVFFEKSGGRLFSSNGTAVTKWW